MKHDQKSQFLRIQLSKSYKQLFSPLFLLILLLPLHLLFLLLHLLPAFPVAFLPLLLPLILLVFPVLLICPFIFCVLL